MRKAIRAIRVLGVSVVVLGLLSARAALSAEVAEPKWLTGKPLNEWFPIEGTKGAGGAPVNDFSGMTVKESTSEIIIAAAGGHGGSRDNRVVSIDLRADAPAWIQRHAPSPSAPDNVDYNPDGQPASRHTYASTQYVASLDRVFLVGCRFTTPGSYEYPHLDSFNLATNTWDPKGTNPEIPKGSGYGVVSNPATGDLFTQTMAMWSPATKTWSTPITKPAPVGVRFPFAFDTKRNQIFGLNYGDGQGYGDPKVTAVRESLSAKQGFQVTIAPGDALTQFLKDTPTYCGMDYDPDHDRFLYYCGQGEGAGRIYVITPNDTNTWEMSLFKFGAGSKTPPAAGGAGINNRFRYIPQLKGFVLLEDGRENLFFIRTANLGKATAAAPAPAPKK